MKFSVCVKVSGRIEYHSYSENENAAKTKAEMLATEADCGELEDIEWEAKSAIVLRQGEYIVPVRFTGYVEYEVTANSKEEAADKANELAENDNFGELEDIEWEVVDD